MKKYESRELAEFTTFQIGGEVPELWEPETVPELQELLPSGRPESTFVFGCGSNLLVPENQLNGRFIRLENLSDYEFRGREVILGAGCKLGQVVSETVSRGLSGFEWAAGVPGSVGGALAMNSGAFGQVISDYLETVKLVDWEGNLEEIAAADLEFGYRHSEFSGRGVLVEAKFRLENSTSEAVRDQVDKWLRRRKSTQPVGKKCAGSVFKNPGGESAGELIEAAGLKGVREGEAQISQKHANFIINCGDARYADVLRLIKRVRHRIFQLYDLELELEIEVLSGATAEAPVEI